MLAPYYMNLPFANSRLLGDNGPTEFQYIACFKFKGVAKKNPIYK